MNSMRRFFPTASAAVGIFLVFGAGAASAQLQYFWDCTKSPWAAYTTYRSMEGWTAFECGGGCGDSSHNQPTSWVDITGGISQSQEDHSDSFFGPLGGEWNGCALHGVHQESTGARWIAGVNQYWDRWPLGFGTGRFYEDDLSYINGQAYPMRTPFASVYDLDCVSGWISWLWGGSCPKDIVGTIFWDNFPVTARLIGGNPIAEPEQAYGSATWQLEGDTGVFCSAPENGCQSVVCADLHVRATLHCVRGAVDPVEEMCNNLLPEMEIPWECLHLLR